MQLRIRRSPIRPSEYHIKAAFVYKFPQFVEWQPRDRAATVFCVTGKMQLFQALHEIMRERATAPSKASVKWLVSRPSSAQQCDVLFVGSQGKTAAATLGTARDSSVLTIGESKDFLESGGIVKFVMENNAVRFGFNLGASRRARLTISSRLLRLSTRVCEPCSPGK